MNFSFRVAIFTDDIGWHGKQLERAFANWRVQTVFVSLRDCAFNLSVSARLPIHIPGFEQALPDAVFVRGVCGGLLEEVVLYLDFLHALKQLGIPVYNDGQVIERSVDKAMSSFLFHWAGIATPPTWVLRCKTSAIALVKQELEQGHFVISKPLFGSQGEGVRRIEKSSDLIWLSDGGGVYYLQRFVHCLGEGFCDFRVFVIDGKVVAGMRRSGLSWLNNVAQGGHCQKIAVDTTMAQLAIKVTQTLNMDYAGVDIIEDANGLSVIEVNSVPAWKGLQTCCDIDVAALLVSDLMTRYVVKNINHG